MLADLFDGACALLSLPWMAWRILHPASPRWNDNEETNA